MEVKSASGGTESSLFAEDLMNMYKLYISKMGWNIDTISYAADMALGKGCKNGSFKLTGQSIYKYFKYEAGVHKVQRVPVTEKNGRIHSSTCQVAILADVKFVTQEIDERDLRIDYFRASGAGGQSVNKTESAVRLTHIPSGLVVQNQDERDQHRNKAKAMEVLKQRLNDKLHGDFNEGVASIRKSQIGMGNLSEKIRTYNWPDSRVTGKMIFNILDHRVGLTLYGIDNILNGNHLETIHEKLIEKERIDKLNIVLQKLQII
jgi:peptide chain release factor 1